MVAKRLKSGATAYYWNPPTWSKKKGCTLGSEALGTDYAQAKQRCDEVLNPHFDAWLAGNSPEAIATDRPAVGTFDWMVSIYKTLPKYTRRPAKTRKSYDSALRLVSQHKLKDGRLFGSLPIASIKPATADILFDKLRTVQEPVLDSEGKPIIGNNGTPVMRARANPHRGACNGVLSHRLELGAARQARDHPDLEPLRRGGHGRVQGQADTAGNARRIAALREGRRRGRR
jgi:hypothetical protein